MPTGSQPPLSASLTSSPLSRLPPEVRALIYLFTLTQPSELSISKRRFIAQYHPYGLNPNKCMHCQRIRASCQCSVLPPGVEFYYDPHPAPTRTISPAILRTCRIIYNEAAPLLYRCNRFHFADPDTVELFHEHVDKRHSHLVEAIMLTVYPQDLQSFPGGISNRSASTWETLTLEPNKLLLPLRHFTLRSIIIRLRGRHESDDISQQTRVCSAIAQQLPPLKWIHVDGLSDVDAVRDLGAVVRRPWTNGGDVRSVQVATSEAWSREGWQNVTLWWGNEGDRAPYTPPWESRMGGLRSILLQSGSYCAVREEILPCAGGVGGVEGASAFL